MTTLFGPLTPIHTGVLSRLKISQVVDWQSESCELRVASYQLRVAPVLRVASYELVVKSASWYI